MAERVNLIFHIHENSLMYLSRITVRISFRLNRHKKSIKIYTLYVNFEIERERERERQI